MKKTKAVNVIVSVLVWCAFAQPAEAASRKLKVFILAGQSNMEGHAEVGTFDYIGKDPRRLQRRLPLYGQCKDLRADRQGIRGSDDDDAEELGKQNHSRT
jgi:hypothetical protein